MFPNSFWDEQHADIKTRQRYTKIKLQAHINDEFRGKYHQQNLIKPNPTTHLKKNHTPWSSGIYTRNIRIFSIFKSIHVNKLKEIETI